MILRGMIAVLVGFITTVGLVLILTYFAAQSLGIGPTGTPTPLYLALNLLASAAAGVAGGAVAGRLAPVRPHGHVFALAIIILLLSLPTLFAAPSPGQPTWYAPVLSILGPLSIIVGGMATLRLRR